MQHPAMARPKSEIETLQIGLRLETELVRAIDEEAFRRSAPGKIVTRTDIIREALHRQLKVPAPKRK